jgi:hypothetical protein
MSSLKAARCLTLLGLLLATTSLTVPQQVPSTCANISHTEILNTTSNGGTPIGFYGGEGAGVAADPTSGDVYVAENPFAFQGLGAPQIVVIHTNGTLTALAPPGGFGDVTAVLFTGGILYVADGSGYTDSGQLNVVWQYVPGTQTWSQIVTGVNDPTGLAFDSAGNLYVASWSDQAVYKYLAGQFASAPTTFWTAPDPSVAPYGLAIDQGNNLYIADFGTASVQGTKIYRVNPSGTSSVFFDASVSTPGLIQPDSVAIDGNGYLYAAYYGGLKIVRIAPDGSVVVLPGGGTGDDAANGLAITPQGNIITIVNGARSTSDANAAVISISGLTPSINPAAEFQSATNPNAAWAYGNTTAGPVFNPLNSDPNVSATNFASGQAAATGLDFWITNPPFDPSNLDPDIFHNGQSSTLTPATNCCGPVPPGGLGFQPSSSALNNNPTLRWTASFAGNFQMLGIWSGLDFSGPTSTTGTVTQTSGGIATTLQSSPVSGFGAIGSAPFSTPVTAAQCDTVDLTVSAGSNNLMTGLDAVILPAASTSPVAFSPTVPFTGGTAVGLSIASTLTLTNTGSDSLNLETIQLIGANVADFSTVSDSCSGATLVAAGTCSFQVIAQPTALGARSATAQFFFTDPSAAQTSSEALPLAIVGQPNTSVNLAGDNALNTDPYGSPVNFTAAITTPLSGAPTPTGTVQFFDGGSAIQTPIAVTNGQAQLSDSSLSVGPHTITAVYSPAAPTPFVGISTNSLVETITQAAPTTSLSAPASAAYQSTFTVTPTTNASTTATITANAGSVCTIAGTTVTMTSGTGSCSLTATWPADANYSAGTATSTTTATMIAPTTSLSAPASAAYQSKFTVTATTNASTTATITANAGSVCTISGTTATMTGGTGVCSLTATWTADANYSAGTATSTTTATMIAPTASLNAPASAAYQSTFAVTATTNASTAAKISVNAGSVCTISGTTVTMTGGTGACSLTATWAADANYAAGTAASTTTASKIAPAVSFTGAPASAPNQTSFVVTAATNASTIPAITGTAGICSVGAVSGTPASASATVMMQSSTGSCALLASWQADNNYNGATANQSTTATASTGGLSVSPISLPFPATVLNTASAGIGLTLRNTSSATVSGINLGFSGPFMRASGAASGTCASTPTLAAGAHCTINVVFTPTALGSATGSLSITANVPVSGSPVALSGTGVEPSVALNLSSTQTGTFGNVVLGTNSAVATYTLSANGPIDYAIGGLAGTQFNRPISGAGLGGTCTTGALTGSGSGASCTIRVRFSPTALGAAQTSLAITATDTAATPDTLAVTGSPQTLTGAGIDPTVTLTPTQTGNFGNVVVGTNSASATYTLSTNGPINYAVGSLSGTEFNRPSGGGGGTCASTTSGTLTGSGSGASCTIRVRFSPTTVGATQTSLTVSASDDAAPPNTLTVTGSPTVLSGTGVQAAALLGAQAPAPISSARGCGSSGRPACGQATVSLTNNGTATLTILGVSSVSPGTHPGYFVLSNNCGGSVAVSSQCAITITFQPPLSATPNAAQTSTLSLRYNSGSGTATQTTTTGLSGQESN